jgi:hypothetical protein
MSLNRVVLVSLAAVFTVGTTSFASAGGWGWGSGWGCGGCAAPSAAIVYAQPVLPPPPPVTYSFTSGCGCGHQSIVYAEPPIEPTPIAPAPIYVVNQGPEYEGPGITVPYHTWAPVSAYGPTIGYGYRHHFGYGHRWGFGFHTRPYPWRYRARFAYHEHFHERFMGYPHRRWPMRYWTK